MTLHLTKLDAFANWAAQQGYVREQTKGVYEVLRLRREPEPPLLYYRHEGGDHATSTGRATSLVDRWIRERRRQREHQERALA
jgi:hypothetical protein